ncbi:MAG TPA: glycosyltransferase family 2 protein [Cyanothece sp. UBA12306]|nr:glycosyltransferase family 2 protein [Cyanothece sp. UBA12306]
MDLGIVIINYRTPYLVIDCLESLQPQIDINKHRVILVDNDSGDDSLSILEQAILQHQWNEWVNLLPSPVNGGFSAGNNLGIKAVTAENYLLLNSDTIVRPGAIASLLKGMTENPEAGLISPRLEWPDGTPQISCFRNHSPVSELINSAGTGPITSLFSSYNVPISVSDSPFEPQWTSFACVLIRRQVIEQIGLMDEGYFMYFDDNDYCRRAREAGWKVLHWPDAHVVHLRGGSGSVKSDLAKRKRPRNYLYASRSRYFAKFYGILGLWVANLFWLMGRSVSLMRELIGERPTHICEYAEQDIWINWQNPLKLPVLPQSTKINHEQTS